MPKTKYKTWTKIPWDGNHELNLECWRKSFGSGHVSVGIGDFKLICYSYGPNSDDSMSSTRGNMSEEEAMNLVDKKNICF